jgi:hypothetical protein
MNKILTIIIAIFVLYVALSKDGCTYKNQKSNVIIVHDTNWSVHDTTIYKTLKGKVLHDTIATPHEYIADTNHTKLLAQYKDLLVKYLALVEFKDTVKIDTIGYISITDTVNQNAIKGRSIRTNYKIPTITNTITIQNYEKPKAQLYFGGGVDLNSLLAPSGVHAGLMFKTKKDYLLGVQVGTDGNGGINYGFSSYWKIKLK